MYKKITTAIRTALKRLHRDEKGVTGLETAIILIAFVTVASVVAYSVLSAGLYSAERAKETIYRGLEQAKGSLEVKSSLLALSTDQVSVDSVQFSIGLVIPEEQVDTGSIVINYFDDDIHAEGLTATIGLASGSTERGAADLLEYDELHLVQVTMPATATLNACDSFTLELIPPSGSSITIRRSLPGGIKTVNNLH
jgi:flagellin FlaB